uniref:Sex determining protein Fem-1 like protein n=1 Tax=Margaritifera margaritifera TaxID=102329 RepID=A0A068JCU6_PINMG|nr:sex determining protein Fem-1 like protein [Pinctada margaritifera]
MNITDDLPQSGLQTVSKSLCFLIDEISSKLSFLWKDVPKEYVLWRDHDTVSFTAFAVILSISFFTLLIGTCSRHQKSISDFKKSTFTDRDIKRSLNIFDLAKTAYEPGHKQLVIRLLEKYHYDVNYKMPSSGLTLFLCACLSSDKALITYMLKKGADVTLRTRNGDSPLYLATYGIVNSRQPDLSLITELVKAGCGVNTQNFSGYTPLHRAASKGDVRVIKALLKLGADPYLCSKSGIYPIDSALNAGHHEAVELLQIKVKNDHVWEVVDPHTPPRIALGLQSPSRRHLLESARPRTASKIFN